MIHRSTHFLDLSHSKDKMNGNDLILSYSDSCFDGNWGGLSYPLSCVCFSLFYLSSRAGFFYLLLPGNLGLVGFRRAVGVLCDLVLFLPSVLIAQESSKLDSFCLTDLT